MRNFLRSGRGSIVAAVAAFYVALLHAAAFAWLVPAWQAPDEPSHVEYACLMAQLGRTPEKDDRSPVLQGWIIASLDRSDFWRRTGREQPSPLPAAFAADPFLVRSGQQIGDEPPLYYVLPAALCRIGWSAEAQLLAMRLLGAVLFGLAGVITVWAWESGRTAAAGSFGLQHGLFMALLPMPAFISGSANNDALALATATAVFAALTRLQRLGWSWSRAMGVLLLLTIALFSKKTNAFLLPWLLLLGAAAGYRRLVRLQAWQRQPGRVLLVAGVIIGLLIGWLAAPSAAPAHWHGRLQPLGRGRIALPDSADGWGAQVTDHSRRDTGRLFQSVRVPQALQGQPVVASVLVRSGTGQPQPGRLTVRDAAHYSQMAFLADDRWRRVVLTHTVALATPYVKLIVAPTDGQPTSTGRLLLDSATLSRAESPGLNLLRNPDFVQPARWVEVAVYRPLERRWEEFAPRLDPGAALTPEALGRYALYTALLFPGFWGNFGWLNRPLPIPVYVALAAVCAVALVGLARAWIGGGRSGRPNGSPGASPADPARFVPQWLLAAALALLQALLPMLGRAWQPQGRYLFPALFPITGLLLVGLNAALDLDRRPRRLAVALALLLALDLLSLLRAAFVI
ncbi:MAG: DUF2142 domain-containing protein [Anaerolineae bacterium]|nr:DUF2142 domain-containing protein [Anaerolineae bacterium]